MPKQPFNIGDTVWYATASTVKKSLLCPECFGKKYITVILGDETTIKIPCVSCTKRDQFSYEDYPTGYINYYEFQAKSEQVVITRVEIDVDKIEYGFNGNYRADNDKIFETESEAVAKAIQLADKHNQEEIEKIKTKEKPERTWSWNVHYHRDSIKKAERELEYHRKKLEYALPKIKEEKAVK